MAQTLGVRAMKKLVALSIAAMAFVPVQAMAATGNLQFNSTVTNTCVINVASAGTLAPNSTFTQLSSKNTGGTPATANVTNTGPDFDLSISITSFTGPDASSATTSAEFSGTGDNAFSATGTGVSVSLPGSGTTAVSADFTADNAAGFSTGTYAATVTLTCAE